MNIKEASTKFELEIEKLIKKFERDTDFHVRELILERYENELVNIKTVVEIKN